MEASGGAWEPIIRAPCLAFGKRYMAQAGNVGISRRQLFRVRHLGGMQAGRGSMENGYLVN